MRERWLVKPSRQVAKRRLNRSMEANEVYTRLEKQFPGKVSGT